MRDRELEAGTAAHYEDPSYYAATYADRQEDLRFYVALAATVRGQILEYGCGNGRLTLPMARAGARVTGIDLSRPMLRDLAKRLALEPPEVRRRVKMTHGDMRTRKLERRHSLVVCPFNAFLHLYARVDVERFLARVHEHLTPGGSFVFDVSIPQPEELARPAEKLHRTPPFNYPGVGVVRYGERFDYEPLRQVLFVSMEFEPKDGSGLFTTPLAHRQFFPAELEALLHYNGFRVAEQWGDFDGPPTKESLTLVYRCKVRPGFRVPGRSLK